MNKYLIQVLLGRIAWIKKNNEQEGYPKIIKGYKACISIIRAWNRYSSTKAYEIISKLFDKYKAHINILKDYDRFPLEVALKVHEMLQIRYNMTEYSESGLGHMRNPNNFFSPTSAIYSFLRGSFTDTYENNYYYYYILGLPKAPESYLLGVQSKNMIHNGCIACGSYSEINGEMIETNEGKYCKACVEITHKKCIHCGRYVLKEDIEEGYCPRCYEDTACCDSCGERFHYDYLHDGYCDSCENSNDYDNEYDDEPDVEDYRTTDNTFNEVKHDISYGIEIETSYPNHGKKWIQVDGFPYTSDGSITGAEYLSPIMNGDKGLEYIKKALQKLNSNGVEVDNACGLHLHMGSKHLPISTVIHVGKCFSKIEDFMFCFVKSNRQTRWCNSIKWVRKVKSTEDFNRHIYGTSNPREDRLKEKGGGERYYSYNLHAHNCKGTIENRMLHGTLDYDEISNWIKLNISLYHHFSTNMPQKLPVFSLKNTERQTRFFNWLLRVTQDEDLVQYCKNKVGERRLERYGQQIQWTAVPQTCIYSMGDFIAGGATEVSSPAQPIEPPIPRGYSPLLNGICSIFEDTEV